MRLSAVEKLPGSRFRYDNHVSYLQLAPPCHGDIATGRIRIATPWVLCGWSDAVADELMYRREGQIGLMLWHPDEGEAWQHYPLFTDEDREAAVFVGPGAGTNKETT